MKKKYGNELQGSAQSLKWDFDLISARQNDVATFWFEEELKRMNKQKCFCK